MTFGNLESDSGLEKLNSYLETRSYIETYTPTIADGIVYKAIKTFPNNKKYPHAARWYEHVLSLGNLDKLPGVKKNIDEYGPVEENEDVDLFGSESEDEDEETRKGKEQRLKEYHERKAKKPAVIAKSSIVVDIKPWDDETDMAVLEKKVREINMDGLLWGASKLVPVGYGIKKLQISCVVEDTKVGVNDLEEEIQKDEENVQSVDIVSFNKV